MNRTIKRGLLACAVAALAAQVAFAQDAEQKEYEGAPDPKSYGYTVLAVGLATPLTLPWGYGWDVFGLEANLLYSDCNKMYGIEFACGANVARLDMIGIQASALFNFANRNAYGIQAALANMGNRETSGIVLGAANLNREFSGIAANVLFGATDENFYGLNLSGLGSGVREDMWGVQLSAGANFARRVHGLQFAIGYNMTEELRGAQVGLVNWATTCSAGFQVGLVNIITDNQLPFLPIFNCYF